MLSRDYYREITRQLKEHFPRNHRLGEYEITIRRYRDCGDHVEHDFPNGELEGYQLTLADGRWAWVIAEGPAEWPGQVSEMMSKLKGLAEGESAMDGNRELSDGRGVPV